MQVPISLPVPSGINAEWFPIDFLVYAVAALVFAVCVGTRIVTGAAYHLRRPGQPGLLYPYWIPYVGHALSLAFCRQWLMKKARNNAAGPAFQLVVMGRTVNVVTSPSLITTLSSQKNSSLERGFTDRLSDNLFGRHESARKVDEPGFPFSSSWVFLMEPSEAKELCKSVISQAECNTADFVSFLSSPVDQYLWERSAGIDIPANTRDTCTANLHALVRGFVTITVITHLMGTTFVEAYEVVADDLFVFNEQVNAISLGLPRYFPMPGLVPAYSCRRRLLEGLSKFHMAFRMIETGGDPGIEWRDFDDVSGFMRNRARRYMDTGVSIEGAARQDLALLWAMNTRLSTLVFWVTAYILSNEERRVRTMQEAERFVNISRPPPFGMFREPIKTSLDVDGLAHKDKCPLVNAVYYETLRIQSSEFAVRTMTRDYKWTGTERPAECHFKEGDVFAYNCLLSNMEEPFFDHPSEFRLERFLPTTDTSNGSDATNGVTRGELQTLLCPNTEDEAAREFKEECEKKIILAFAMALIMAYDITPEKGKWEIPSSRAAGLSNQPRKDIRVRIKPKN